MNELKGYKSLFTSKGVIGAIAVIIATFAGVLGYSEVKSEDISGLVTYTITFFGGLTLAIHRINQWRKGLDWISGFTAAVTAIVGAYIAVTGDKETGDAILANVNGIIIALGSILSAFGIHVAEKKIG